MEALIAIRKVKPLKQNGTKMCSSWFYIYFPGINLKTKERNHSVKKELENISALITMANQM